ncbi:MAG: hypothetical protein KGP10_09155 [Actinomycetales bacterium]|nr:hypothetical protein [Actinomycetales bacterium]
MRVGRPEVAMLLKLDSGTAGAGETAADTRERSQAILDQVVVDLTAVVDGTFDDGRALPERLAQLVERWQGLAVVSLTGDERAFDAVTDLSALRIWIFEIVEEGIYNAVTHGCGTHIDVHMAVESDAIEVNVRDDGIGVRIDAEQGLGRSRPVRCAPPDNSELLVWATRIPGAFCGPCAFVV